MIHFKDITKDKTMYVEDMCIGETFKLGEDYYVVMESENDGYFPCYDFFNNRVIEFDGHEEGVVVEIDCVVREA